MGVRDVAGLFVRVTRELVGLALIEVGTRVYGDVLQLEPPEPEEGPDDGALVWPPVVLGERARAMVAEGQTATHESSHAPRTEKEPLRGSLADRKARAQRSGA
jgi:hypothetical protein